MLHQALRFGMVLMEEKHLIDFLFTSEDELKSYSDSFESRARDRFCANVPRDRGRKRATGSRIGRAEHGQALALVVGRAKSIFVFRAGNDRAEQDQDSRRCPA